MKRLFFLALLALAGWYGWHHYHEVLTKTPKHEAVLVNQAGETLTRIRLTVGGQTFVREQLDPGASVTYPFAVTQDSKFDLQWDYLSDMREGRWSGGQVTKGPLLKRHTFTLRPERGVIYESVPLAGN